MFPYEPDDPNDRQRPGQHEPYPGIGSSLLLMLMGMVASVFTAVALLGLGELAAQGIGRAIGFGAVASLALQRIPPPHGPRLGFRTLAPESIPLILCLVPAALLMSELDNYAYDWAPDEPSLIEALEPPQEGGEETGATNTTVDVDFGGDVDDELAEGIDPEERRLIDPDDPWTMLQGLILMVVLVPVIDGFFFFGILQQGLVRRMGMWQGVFLAGLFWMLMRDFPITGFTRFAVGSISLLAMGWLLGIVRVATGSVLGPMLLFAGWSAISFVSTAYRGVADLPGLNVDGTHLPFTLTLGSLGIVAWATWTIAQEAQRRNAEIAANVPTDDGRKTRTNVRDLRPPDDD